MAGEGQEVFGLGGDFDYPEDYVSPGAGVEVEDDTVPVATATTIDFGDDLAVTDDGGGHLTVDSTAVTDQELADHEADTSTHGVAEVAGIADITFETLDSAGDVGTGASTLAEGDHTHPGGGTTIDVSEDAGAADAVGAIDFGNGLDVTVVGATATVEVDETELAHLTDAADAHDASAISADSTTLVGIGTDVQAVLEELDDAVAAIRALDFIVGTATTELSGEIVAGTAPGGELGGTWGTPTVDATHAGSTHSAAADTHIADSSDAHDASAISADSTTLVGVGTDVQAVLEELDNGIADHLADTGDAHDASAISIADAGNDFTATDVEGALDELQADNEAHVAAADPHGGYQLESLYDAKGDIITGSADNTPAKTTVGANDTILMADSAAGGGVKWVASAAPAAVGTAAVEGTADTYTRGDHVHAHEAAHVAHDTIWDTKGDIVAATAADTATKLAVGANGSKLTPKSGDATGIAWVDDEFTVGGVLLDPSGARTIEVWRAPFACEVMGYRARVVGGTNAVTNAQVDSSDILTGDLTTTPADSWEAGTIVSSGVEDIAAGEVIKLEVVSISGAVTEISWTILLRKVA